MFNKEKKYTLEEIKVMFNKVEEKAIAKLDSDITNAMARSGKNDPMSKMIMGMQNIMAIAELKNQLFNEDTE